MGTILRANFQIGRLRVRLGHPRVGLFSGSDALKKLATSLERAGVSVRRSSEAPEPEAVTLACCRVSEGE